MYTNKQTQHTESQNTQQAILVVTHDTQSYSRSSQTLLQADDQAEKKKKSPEDGNLFLMQ